MSMNYDTTARRVDPVGAFSFHASWMVEAGPISWSSSHQSVIVAMNI